MRGALALLLLFNSVAFAGNQGTTTAQFLELGAGARAAGMGEASAASTWDATAVRYNPAAMTRVEENSASFMHDEHLQSTFLDNLAYVRRLSAQNAAGLSLSYMNYGSIAITDESTAQIGTAHPSDLAVTAAFARQFDDVAGPLRGSSLGLSLSYIQSKIVDSATTEAASLGFLSRPFGLNRVRFAAVVDNIGGTMKFDKASDPLPMTLRVGAAGYITHDWLLSAEVADPKGASVFGALGMEKWIGSPYERGLALRAGYNTRSTGDLSGLTGLSLGLGFALNAVMLDYAFVPFGELGYTHRISLSLRFGSEDAQMASAPPPMESPAKAAAAPSLPAPPAEPAKAAGPPSPSPLPHAGEDARRAGEGTKDLAAPRILAAKLMMSQGRYSDAHEEWTSAARLLSADDERSVFVYERMGAAAVREKEIQDAKAAYLRAIEFAKAHRIEDDSLVNAYLGLAWCLSVQGQVPSAINNYARAKQLSDNDATRQKIDAKIAELKHLK